MKIRSIALLLMTTLCFAEANAGDAESDFCGTDHAAFVASVPESMRKSVTLAAIAAHSGDVAQIEAITKEAEHGFQTSDAAYRRSLPAFEATKAEALIIKPYGADSTRRVAESRLVEASSLYADILQQASLPETQRRLAHIGLARIAMYRDDLKKVAAELQPLIADQCGSLPAVAHYWLAESLSDSAQKAAGLLQIQAALKEENHPPIAWLELAMQLSCSNGRAGECTEYLLSIVRSPFANPENAAWLSEYAAKLAVLPVTATAMKAAQAEGLFDSVWHVHLNPLPVVVNVEPLKRTEPRWPTFGPGRDAGVGLVFVLIRIGKDGTVEDAWIDWSLPPKAFDRAVLDAVKEWTFKPSMINGVPAEQLAIQRINFYR